MCESCKGECKRKHIRATMWLTPDLGRFPKCWFSKELLMGGVCDNFSVPLWVFMSPLTKPLADDSCEPGKDADGAAAVAAGTGMARAADFLRVVMPVVGGRGAAVVTSSVLVSLRPATSCAPASSEMPPKSRLPIRWRPSSVSTDCWRLRVRLPVRRRVCIVV